MGDDADIARRGRDVLARRSFEEAHRLCAPGVELWTLYDEDGKEPQFRGQDGLLRWFERLDELWAYLEILDVEVDERGGGWVLMRVRARVRGRGSPHDFELPVAVAIHVRDGRIGRAGLFVWEAEARAMIAGG